MLLAEGDGAVGGGVGVGGELFRCKYDSAGRAGRAGKPVPAGALAVSVRLAPGGVEFRQGRREALRQPTPTSVPMGS